MIRKKYFGDRAFYRYTMSIALPIMIQNFITNLVNMLDNLMVGAVGTEPMSGVSIDNQLIFIFNLACFGIVSGAGIFTAQFNGKDDNEGIRYTLRYKLIAVVTISAAAILIFSLFDKELISLYLHKGETEGDLVSTLHFAQDYLKIILWGLFPFALTQVFAGTLRETGETVAPMVTGFAAVFTNCALNYVLIFGKFGAPKMGVKGAAIATVISRFVECICIVIYSYSKKKRFPYFNKAFTSLYIPKKLAGQVTLKAMPLLFNEFFWSLGISMLSMGYSLYGINVVAGYSITSTVMNLFNIAFLSLGSSIGIFVGKELGANEFEKAVDTTRKMVVFCVGVSLFISAVVIFAGGYVPLIYKTNEASKNNAAYFIRTSGFFLPAISISNASYFTLRSGGKTWITVLFDSVFVMCVSVPAVFILYKLGLSIWVLFPIVQSLEILKAISGLILLSKKVWVNNIVE